MKAWTHQVLCNETRPNYDRDTYTIHAVKTRQGWRCAEKNLAGVRYGQLLSGVRVKCRRRS